MAGPAWLEDIRRQKVVEPEKPSDIDQLRGDFSELRLRYIKVVGDNITLRNALSAQRRSSRHKSYEQESEISPGIGGDYNEDLVAYSERLQREREGW